MNEAGTLTTIEIIAAVGAIGGLLVFGLGLGKFVQKFNELIRRFEIIGVKMSEQTHAQAESSRLLIDLVRVHSPELSGGAGFGTVELREQVSRVEKELALSKVVSDARHERETAAHGSIVNQLNRIEGVLAALVAHRADE